MGGERGFPTGIFAEQEPAGVVHAGKNAFMLAVIQVHFHAGRAAPEVVDAGTQGGEAPVGQLIHGGVQTGKDGDGENAERGRGVQNIGQAGGGGAEGGVLRGGLIGDVDAKADDGQVGLKRVQQQAGEFFFRRP